MTLSRSTRPSGGKTGSNVRGQLTVELGFSCFRLLDFGCGTGETTLALAQGVLGGLGTAGEVVGVDLSQEMIKHCQSQYHTSNPSNTPSLSFSQVDVTQAESFISSNLASFSCLTSFSCLHWVQDMPAAVRFFNKVG